MLGWLGVLLHILHFPLLQNCDSVVSAIKDTGLIKREQRDLEEQVRGVAVM